jgi:hypothetical protein
VLVFNTLNQLAMARSRRVVPNAILAMSNHRRECSASASEQRKVPMLTWSLHAVRSQEVEAGVQDAVVAGVHDEGRASKQVAEEQL